MISSPRNPSNSTGFRTPTGRSPGTTSDASVHAAAIRDRVQRRLLAELSPSVSTDNLDEVRRTLERIFNETLAEEPMPLSRAERSDLFEQVVADILGYGPIEPLLRNDTITEVLVNGPDQVYIERNGKLEQTEIRFRDASEVMRIIDRIVAPVGRRVDEASPMVDARLPDGSRVNVIIPPLSLIGPCISIRKFARTAYSVDDLLRFSTMTRDMADFLRACVLGRLNVVVSGGTSTGKTTLLNVLSSFLPSNERIITIEDAAELRLHDGAESVSARVYPALIPLSHPLATVNGAYNAVVVEAENAGRLMFYGQGAGGAPTASAVMGDVVMAARNKVHAGRGPLESTYASLPVVAIKDVPTRYYVAMNVLDRPGVLEGVAGEFAKHDVSIAAVRQEGDGEQTRLVVITHRAPDGALAQTVAALESMEAVTAVSSVLRMEGTDD